LVGWFQDIRQKKVNLKQSLTQYRSFAGILINFKAFPDVTSMRKLCFLLSMVMMVGGDP
jgi:hypothetical protein